MNAIQLYTFPDTGQPVRTVALDGEPWWVAKDVCDVVGIAKYRDAVAQLDEDERVSTAVDTPGGPQVMTVVSEPGIYALMLISRSQRVQPFRRWLTHEVIPSLRTTGSYSTPAAAPAIPTHPEALRGWAAEIEARQVAEARVAELEPAAGAWGTLATAHGDYDVARAAQILSRDPAIRVGRGRLFTWLAKNAWIYRGPEGRWCAYQRQIDTGRLMLLPSSHYHPRTGELVLDPPQIRVTVKGLLELHRVLGGVENLALDDLAGVGADA